MTNAKNTKRALLTSVLAILACVAMLIGTTFAWFTDTASTAVNKIVSGKLHIELLDENGTPLASDHTLNWKTEDTGDILWEPNCTYDLEPFQIKNAGTLALKYKVILKATDITVKDGKSLLDVIDWTLKLGDDVLDVTSEQIKADLGGGIAIITDRPLLPTEIEKISITGHMKAEAGNDYQDLSIDGFGVTVVATQYTHEKDSKDDQYDADATYPVTDAAGLKAALANAADGASITLSGTADLSSETIALDKDVTITGEDAAIRNVYFTVADGKKVRFDGVAIEATTTIRATDDADLTFTDCVFDVTPEKKNGNGRAAAIIGNHQYSNVQLTLQGCTFNYHASDDDTYDTYNMAVFMWSNVENVLIKDCVFNDYGFVAVKFLEMKAGANIVFEGNTFNMSKEDAGNWYYNTAVQIHSVNQPTGNCSVSFINNTFTGDYQTGASSGYTGYKDSSAPIVAELLWNADDAPLDNTTLIISGNSVNGKAVTEENFVFYKGTGSSTVVK